MKYRSVLILIFLLGSVASAEQPVKQMPVINPNDEILFKRGFAVFFQEDQKWLPLEAKEDAKTDAPDVATLPLVVTDVSTVTFEGKVFSVEREGLYRFVRFPNTVINLISRKGRDSLLPVLVGLSQLHMHGNAHEKVDLEEATKQLKTLPWISRTCGPMRNVAWNVIHMQAGKKYFWPRGVDGLTMAELSGFDDGHSLFEVYSPGDKRRILVDIDMGYLFREKPDGPFLAAVELWQLIHENKPFELYRLSTKEVDSSFPYALTGRLQTSSPERVKAWYRRVMQIISIDGKAMYWDQASKDRITKIWGAEAAVEQGEWMNKHYSPKGIHAVE
jgi:hypothetical protein